MPCFFLFGVLFFWSPHGLQASEQLNFFDVVAFDQQNVPIKNLVVINSETLSVADARELAVMDQQNKTFVPHVLVVNTRTKVSFPNSDNIRHHVYSFSKPKRFEIKLYADTPEAPVLFDESGVVVLGCNIHDSMVGYIFVSKWRYLALTDEQGEGKIGFENQRPESLLLWHPRLPDPTQPMKVDNLDYGNGSLRLHLELLPTETKKKKSRFR